MGRTGSQATASRKTAKPPLRSTMAYGKPAFSGSPRVDAQTI